jgi:hypothetical protein
VAEWLGSALQKLLQRFESARYLCKNPDYVISGIFDFLENRLQLKAQFFVIHLIALKSLVSIGCKGI